MRSIHRDAIGVRYVIVTREARWSFAAALAVLAVVKRVPAASR
jgi:hypothetical protein